MKDTKTIQTLASVSLIGGPLSIIIGGVLLSTAALVCGIVAFVMVRKMQGAAEGAQSTAIEQALTRQAIIGIAVSALALVMNVASVIMMLPAIMDAVQTGDYSSLLGGGASGSTDSGGAFGGGSGGSSVESAQGGKSSIWG